MSASSVAGTALFGQLMSEPLRNGLTKPKAVRGGGTKIVNMGELFRHPRMRNVKAERAPLAAGEERFLLAPGDLLFARQSLTLAGAGQCSIFLSDQDPAVFESHIIRCRLDKEQTDPLFYFYYFQSKSGRDSVIAIVEQVAAAGIRSSDLARLRVPVPSLDLQRAVAGLLGSLDDKIELNRQMNETLEAMARALFKSWFVDFDPVHAKMAGRAPFGMDAATAALFPRDFADSSVGLIPGSWGVRQLSDVIDLSYGKALKAEDRRPGGVRVFGSGGQVGWHDQALVLGPGIIVGRKGNAGAVSWSPSDFFPIDTAFYVRRLEPSTSMLFVFQVLRHQDLASVGADSAVPGLNRTIALMNKVVWPPGPVAAAFDGIASSLANRATLNDAECTTLTELRDLLLPKLLSGELRIRDAEKAVEAVL